MDTTPAATALRPLPAAAPEPRFSAVVRAQTQPAHQAAEDRFALSSRLVDLASYGALLVCLHGFYRRTEQALVRLSLWAELSPTLDIAGRVRVPLLERDLAALGLGVPVGPGAPAASLPAVSLPSALGQLYVLEGSALGGAIIARQARLRLGPQVPVAFFSSAGRSQLGADWRALQAALDRFGANAGPAGQAELVAAAVATFTDLQACLSAPERNR